MTGSHFGLTLAPIEDNNEDRAMQNTTWSGAALGALALALAAIAPTAPAQYGRDGEVTCESQDGRTRECRTPFRDPVVSETLSSASCVEGRSWGHRGGGVVWVTDGCRARFADSRGGGGGWGGGGGSNQLVRCESNDGRMRECAIPRGARVEVARQLSDARCDEGRSWGQRSDMVWVSRGCRADFAISSGYGGGYGGGRPNPGYGQGRELTCSSDDRRDNSCDWNARWGRPVLLEQLSSDSCREGYTWGYDDRARRIWVTRGCRGRFGSR